MSNLNLLCIYIAQRENKKTNKQKVYIKIMPKFKPTTTIIYFLYATLFKGNIINILMFNKYKHKPKY